MNVNNEALYLVYHTGCLDVAFIFIISNCVSTVIILVILILRDRKGSFNV